MLRQRYQTHLRLPWDLHLIHISSLVWLVFPKVRQPFQGWSKGNQMENHILRVPQFQDAPISEESQKSFGHGSTGGECCLLPVILSALSRQKRVHAYVPCHFLTCACQIELGIFFNTDEAEPTGGPTFDAGRYSRKAAAAVSWSMPTCRPFEKACAKAPRRPAHGLGDTRTILGLSFPDRAGFMGRT